MAPLIKVEVLGTAGDVVATTVHEAPVVIGASPTANLRIRGEGIAGEHLQVAVAPSGAIALRQMDEAHETFVGALSLTTAEVASPVVLTVGDVGLRLSRTEEAEPPPPAEDRSGPRRGRAWALYSVSLGLAAVAAYVTDYTDSPGEETAYLVLGVAVVTLLWVGTWAVGNRIFRYPLAFAGHLRVTALFLIAGLGLSAVEAVLLASAQVSGLGVLVNWALWAPWTVAFLAAHMSVAGAWTRRRVLLVSAGIYLGVTALAGLLPEDPTPAGQVQAALRPIGFLPSGLYLAGAASVVGEDAEALVREVQSLPSARTVTDR